MRIHDLRIPTCMGCLSLLIAGVLSLSLTAQAQTFKVLYKFTGGSDGAEPYAGVVADADGNLYGTTYYGGSSGYGTVYELTPGSGGWQESVLHAFTDGEDGGLPFAGLTFDSAGNLYGTASSGGTGCGGGCGTVFELSPGWSFTVLYNFQGGAGGGNPDAGVILDRHGNLYSTSNAGGKDGDGSVFELSQGTGGWKETLLHSFNGKDGCELIDTPIFDAAGNLFGTTLVCGSGGGTVWELLHGSWKEKTLYSFTGSGGDNSWTGVVLDKAGNIYGVTRSGGKYEQGVVFKLAPQSRGKWKETVLHSFEGGPDGDQPFTTPVLDKAGNLWGTTSSGGDLSCGAPYGCGTVFKLTPGKGGRWKKTIVHAFAGNDGWDPDLGNLMIDAAGNIYGTTVFGGQGDCFSGDGCGVVFEITP